MWRSILILALLMHGVGHSMGFMAAWTTVPMGFSQAAWAAVPSITWTSTAGRIFGLLWLVPMVMYLWAVFALVQHDPLWIQWAGVASFVSLLLWLPGWNTVPLGSLIGAAVFDLFLLAAWLDPWQSRFAESIR